MGDGLKAAADAFASTEVAGIGGWFCQSGALKGEEIWWFSLEVSPSLFPREWNLREDPQRDIAFYEVISQVALLWAKGSLCKCSRMRLHLQHAGDNLGDVAAVNKWFSTKAPLSYGLQALAAIAISRDVTLEMQHIPGDKNVLADGLSRMPESKVSASSFGLREDRQIRLSISDILGPLWSIQSGV
jgi:hypothetical protein